MESNNNLKNRRNVKYFWIVVVLIGLIYFIAKERKSGDLITETRDTTSTSTIQKNNFRSEDTYTYSVDLLNALNSYYYASTRDISLAGKEDPNSVLLNIMRLLMEQNRHFSTGNQLLTKYTTNTNEVISTSAKGSIAGASQLIQANNELIDFLRNEDQKNPKFEQELSYRMADYGSKQKEGYKLIYISAPAVGFLYFEGIKSPNPTGPIPYKISNEQRYSLIDKINKDFRSSMNEDQRNYEITKTHNAIILTVQNILSYIIYDNYEDSQE